MACTLSSMNNSTTITNLQSNRFFFFKSQNESKRIQSVKLFKIRASSDNSEECNVEECAPDKEVGKISMEWVAEERTKVVGTYPPRKKGWTGYVEKDTAGQTNIYSVEPVVYVAESVISSGTSGSSSDGAENIAAVVAGIGLICVAAASSILLQVGKNSPPEVQTVEYSGPSLSYYITKLKPPETIQASVPTEIIPEQSPVLSEETSAPVVSEETSAPVISEETSAPVVSEENSAPVVSEENSAPVVSEENSAPVLSEVETLSALLDAELLY